MEAGVQELQELQELQEFRSQESGGRYWLRMDC